MTAVPNTPKGVRTRAHILDAARRVFARDGYVGATMSGVKDEASISLGGLYRYFTDKEDLFEAVIAGVHEELYRASGTNSHDFGSAPYDALLEANRGYLEHYFEHRDVMRAFIEAASVDRRFRLFWWQMRNRHIDRFVRALHSTHRIDAVGGVPARLAAEATACLVEQSAYVWYAHGDLREDEVPIADAARVVTNAWYNMFFADRITPAGASPGEVFLDP